MYELMVQSTYQQDGWEAHYTGNGAFSYWQRNTTAAFERSTDPGRPFWGLHENGTSCHPDSTEWPLTYADTMLARANLKDEDVGISCTPGKFMVYIFFFTFQTLTQMIVLNLFIGTYARSSSVDCALAHSFSCFSCLPRLSISRDYRRL